MNSTHRVPESIFAKLTVQNMVDTVMDKKGHYGIDGYNLPHTITNFDKPVNYKIARLSDKKHDYISTVLKVKNNIPGPIYDIS